VQKTKNRVLTGTLMLWIVLKKSGAKNISISPITGVSAAQYSISLKWLANPASRKFYFVSVIWVAGFAEQIFPQTFDERLPCFLQK